MDKAGSNQRTVTKPEDDNMESQIGDALDRPVAWCSNLQPVDENVCNNFVSIYFIITFLVVVSCQESDEETARGK